MDKLIDKFKSILKSPKIIFLILGIIIAGELVYAVKVLNTPVPIPSPLPLAKAEDPLRGGSITLRASQVNPALGETVSVAVLIDSGGHRLAGADLIVSFNPKALEVNTEGLIKGRIFEEYPLLSVDGSKGLISISGINSVKKGFKGTGVLANIVFKAKVKGQTVVEIDFQKDSTSDSNLVEAGTSKDILESIRNLVLNVQ